MNEDQLLTRDLSPLQLEAMKTRRAPKQSMSTDRIHLLSALNGLITAIEAGEDVPKARRKCESRINTILKRKGITL